MISRTRSADGSLVVGLVNSMPDSALKRTERQFAGLLAMAAGGRRVQLELYTIPEVPRSEAAREHVRQHYKELSALWNAELDGLIVTGTQPRASHITEEPYWESIRTLIDWADHNTVSTLCSCLAAHAAVLHLDGIERQHLDAKLSGVYTCATSNTHALARGFRLRQPVPHSRHNDLPRAALLAQGYLVLSESEQTGVDLFLKQRRSLFVFCQGHPEYDSCTLKREYRADIVKFLAGEQNSYPGMPRNYFDRRTRVALEVFRRQAEACRTLDLLPKLPLSIDTDECGNRWRQHAVRLYANWLDCVERRKALRSPPCHVAFGSQPSSLDVS